MKKDKKGMNDMMVGIVLLIIVVLIVITWSSASIKSGTKSIFDKIKKIIGIEEKKDPDKEKEDQRSKQESIKTAVQLYGKLQDSLSRCIKENKNDRLCICDTVDFSSLNDNNLKISIQNGEQVLELLDSSNLPLTDAKNTAYRKSPGKFYMGPISTLFTGSVDSFRNRGRDEDYQNAEDLADLLRGFNRRVQYIKFSKDNILFNIEKNDFVKSEGRMGSINFIKVAEDTIAIDEAGHDFRKCGDKTEDEVKKEKEAIAINSFLGILQGYESCLKKQYSNKKFSGILGACNCGTRINIGGIYDYKIGFQVDAIDEPPYWSTTFELKDIKDNQIRRGTINQIFRPCFSPGCPIESFSAGSIKDYTLDGELWLAKGKQDNKENFETVFFGDKSLPECAS